MSRSLKTVGVAAFAAFAVGGVASSQVEFLPKVDHPVASTPDQIAIGDWDGDGDMDLAVTCDAPERVAIFVNDGRGAFAFSYNVYLTSNSGPKGLAAGDFNRDGDTDLVVVAFGHDQLHVLENLGAGAFAVAEAYPVSHGATYVIAALLDGDADLDLVVTCRDSGSVDVLRGVGSGHFGAATTYPAGVDTRGLCAADLDGDLDLDVAVASHDTEEIVLLMNDGAALFSVGPALSMAPLKPESVVALDLEGDGDVDLATAGFSSSFGLDELSLWVQTAPGTFVNGITYPTLGNDPSVLFVGDFDLDYDADIAVVNENSANLSIFSNNGNGGFGLPRLFDTGTDPGYLCGADFDGNGSIDLATANESGNSLSILRNGNASAFRDLGFALGGTNGLPTLAGIGTLEPLSTTTAVIGNGRPGALSFLVMGFSRIDAKFAGGAFVPAPDAFLNCVLDGDGGFVFQDTWPGEALSGDTFYFQAWILDPAGPRNFAATNALEAIVP